MDISRRDIVLGSAALLAETYSRANLTATVGRRRNPPVRQVDHIMIRTGHPDRLFTFFTEVLRLPVAWPIMTRGQVRSGGVGFGNVNVEAIKFPEQSETASRPQLVGFGFEPYASLEECLAELQSRGIRYGTPRPFVDNAPDGSERTLFTNVTLRQFSDTDRPFDATTHVFISEYSREYVDVDQRRSRLRIELARHGGGPLAVRGVREIVVGTTAFREAHRLWQSFLSPLHPDGGGVWAVGNGPAIRLVPAQENRLQSLVIAVRSLQQARSFLRLDDLLGPVSRAGVIIRAPEIDPLQLLLIQI